MLLSVQLCVLLCRYGVVMTTFVDFITIDMIITYIRMYMWNGCTNSGICINITPLSE